MVPHGLDGACMGEGGLQHVVDGSHEGMFGAHCNSATQMRAAPYLARATPPTLYFLRASQSTGWLCKWLHHFGGPTVEQRAHL